MNKILKLKYFLFFSYFILGCSIYTHFGFSFDEQLEREKGKIYIKYICKLSKSENTKFALKYKDEIDLTTFHDRYQGPVFNIFLAIIEDVFNIVDTQEIFFMRHLITFLVCFCGSFFFYLIIQNRFNNEIISIIGWIVYVLSPRLFAENFYSSKDAVLMSMTTIAFYFLLNILSKPIIIHILLFSLFSALCIDIRIIGLIIPLVGISCLFVFQIFLNKFQKIIKTLLLLLISLSSLIVFTIIFWPLLWQKPFLHLYEAFTVMSKIFWNGEVLYFGKLYKQNNESLPWHYLPVWITITTPFLYIIFFFIGVFFLLLNTLNQSLNKLVIYKEFSFDLSVLMIGILPILIVVFLNAIVYDGWRHVYFIYPSILYFSIYGLHYLKKHFTKYSSVIYSIVILNFFWIIYQIIHLHPLQNIYFNELIQKDLKCRFEVDYWGLGYRKAIEHILNNDQRKNINIAINGNIDAIMMLNKEMKNRVNVFYWGSENCQYKITNFRGHPAFVEDKNIYWNITYKGDQVMTVYKLN